MTTVAASLAMTTSLCAILFGATAQNTETEAPALVQRGVAVHRAGVQLASASPSPLLVLSYNVWWWGNPSSHGGWPTTDYASLPGMHAYWKSLPRVHVVGVQECDGGWAKLSSYFTPAASYLTQVEGQRGPLCTLYDPARFTVLSSGTVSVWEYRYLEYVRLEERSTGATIFFVNTHWDHQARDPDQHARNTAQAIADHATNGDIIIAVGDFNLPPYVHVFPQVFESQLGLRLEGRGSSHAQIDMIWTNHDGTSSCSSPEDTGHAEAGSDHNPVLCEFDIGSGATSTGNTGSNSQDTYEYVGAPQVGGWGGRCQCPSGDVYEVGDNYDSCASLACVGGVVVEACGRDVISPSRQGWRVQCGADNENGVEPVVPTPVPSSADTPTTIPSPAETSTTGPSPAETSSTRPSPAETPSTTPSPVETTTTDLIGVADEYVYVGAPEVGGWGGRCRCPSGTVYEVGDNYDGCESLACVGGTVVAECRNGVISRARAGWRVTCGTDISGTDEEMNTESDQNAPEDSTWVHHPGTNCYQGFGADGIPQKDPCPGYMSLEECKSECVSDPACAGIVMSAQQTAGPCWLRKNVDLSLCSGPGSGYDFWERSR